MPQNVIDSVEDTAIGPQVERGDGYSAGKITELHQHELPVTIIERKPRWRFVDLRELWRYRELLYFLTWRDIKVRYKQTVFGAAWAITGERACCMQPPNWS